MAGVSSSREVIRHLNTLFHCGTVGQLSDAELLERFIASRDQGAEAAFAALVDRHGAMVLGVCRRVLENWHEAEDAFQATFLVLARKAKAIDRREQLANWLYGVARHTALDARARAVRRQAKEKRLGSMLPTEQPERSDTSELRAILDDELARLPERTRAALILCELEGLSRRQAAGRLGISEGTLSSRLARGKEQLRDRLTRRGVALSAAALAAALSGEAHAVIVSPALVDSTIKVATLVAAGSSLTGVVSTSVATLTQGVLKAMLLAKLKFVLMGFASVALVTTGMGVVAQSPAPTSHPPDQDRLKAVEQKLDRLLEVLGGSSRSTSAMPPPVNALVQPGTPVAAYSRVPSADYVLTQPPAVATSPALASPVADTINKARFAHGYGQARATTVPTSPYGQSTSLDGRVASLEQRLNELERRFGEMERRLNQPRSGIDRGIGPDGRPVGSIRRPGSDRSDASPDRSPFGNTNPPESPDQTPFGDTERPASIDDDAIATAPRRAVRPEAPGGSDSADQAPVRRERPKTTDAERPKTTDDLSVPR